MKRWRKAGTISLAAVMLAALPIGAGVVLGGVDRDEEAAVEGNAFWVEAHDGDGDHDVRIFRWGGGPRLGVHVDEVSGDLAADAGLDRPHGALVEEVEKDSPAARAGIEEGDIIVGFDGQRVASVHSLMRMVRETPEGRIVSLDIVRDGSRRSVEAELSAPEGRPIVQKFRRGDPGDVEVEIPEIDIRIPEVMRLRDHKPRLGVSVDSMNSQLADFLGVKRDGGVFIKEVFDGTAAERAGIKAGDVILEMDGRQIDDVGDLVRELQKAEGRTVKILLVRDRSERTVEAAIEERDRDDVEEGRYLSREQRREIQRAAREAARASQEAMRAYREQLRELSRRQWQEHGAAPYFVRTGGGRVEI